MKAEWSVDQCHGSGEGGRQGKRFRVCSRAFRGRAGSDAAEEWKMRPGVKSLELLAEAIKESQEVGRVSLERQGSCCTSTTERDDGKPRKPCRSRF